MWTGWMGPVSVAAVVGGVVLLPTGCTSAGTGVTSDARVVVTVGSAGVARAGSTNASAGPATASTASAWSASVLGPMGTPGSAAGRPLPLWPFTTPAQAQAWQAGYGTTNEQEWHLEAARTALNFTTQYLGYPGMDQITSQVVTGTDALIGVGWDDVGAEYPSREADEPGRHEAAVIHLIRYGSGRNAPWVVVGTNNALITITTPSYGGAVTAPLTVGGLITSVDESLRIKVLGASSTPVAEVGGLPVGGTRQPWSARLALSASRGSVLTIVVSTGGHLRDVERFAVTAVRVG